ncbi:MAG: OmpA family protein [Moraxella sp.]|nr:OmpA family protein [Moraxella sp.]
MKPTSHPTVRLSVVGTLSALLLAGCCGCEGGKPKTDGKTVASTAATTTAATATPTATTTDLDLASLAVSSAALGTFPYVTLPDGYVVSSDAQGGSLIADRFAFWANKAHTITGKTQLLEIVHNNNAYNPTDIQTSLDDTITKLGGVKVFDGQLNADQQGYLADLGELAMGAGDIANHPVSTYVIRRDDGNVWLHFLQSDKKGNLVVTHEGLTNDSAATSDAPTDTAATEAAPTAEEIKAEIENSGKIALKVNFATGKTAILPESQAQIAEVAEFLVAHPDIKVAVNGYTDNVGNAAKNQALSEGRAKAVADAIAALGVDKARLSAHGYGDKDPVADNSTEEGRAQNRRVELAQIQ